MLNNNMGAFKSIWVHFGLEVRLLRTLHLLLLGLACGFLALLLGKLFCLEKALCLLGLFEFFSFFGVKLLLLQLLLSCSGGLCTEILQLLLFVGELLLSLLFLDHGLHFGSLHIAHIRNERSLTHYCA